MRIVQITDLHIGKDGEKTQGVDVRQNFLNVLQKIYQLSPDQLVISGDICYEDPHREVYEWVKARLDLIDIPYNILVGNHDDTMMMADVFDLHHQLLGNDLAYKQAFGTQNILMLDSGKGYLSPTQLTWLKGELDHATSEVLIFMHHPPSLCDIPFMDYNHPLQNIPEVQELLFACPHPVTVFTGHYHAEKTIQKKNITIHITPSTFLQIDQTQKDFKVEHYRIGWRQIDLLDGKLMSRVCYLEGMKNNHETNV